MATGDPDLGARLRSARRSRGLTLKDAAHACLVTEAAVSYWESGKNAVSVSDLKTLCALYGETPNQILGVA